tara:strand:- start:240 stop:800 length:561 start_codon:yes stop_codon:yes gene_type:complete
MKLAKFAKNTQNLNKNIALIGHMGSGKSIIGKLISRKLSFIHLDSDKLIEEYMGHTINDIFINKGESYFRKIEEKIIIKNSTKKNLVLSLGGGSILSEKIRNLLNQKFICIFLDVKIHILAKRLKNSKKRPIIYNTNIEAKLKKLDKIRRKYYLSADIVLINHNSTLEVIEEFKEKYKEFNEKNKS